MAGRLTLSFHNKKRQKGEDLLFLLGLSSPSLTWCTSKHRLRTMSQTPRRRQSDALREVVRFEPLLTDVASRFVGLPAEALDREIEDAQRRICAHLGLERSTLFQFRDSGNAALTHAWTVPDAEPPPAAVGLGQFPWALSRLRDGQRVQFTSLDDLPPEAATDKATFRGLGY
jgi:hypothetical protein